jgi:hypothetical protein
VLAAERTLSLSLPLAPDRCSLKKVICRWIKTPLLLQRTVESLLYSQGGVKKNVVYPLDTYQEVKNAYFDRIDTRIASKLRFVYHPLHYTVCTCVSNPLSVNIPPPPPRLLDAHPKQSGCKECIPKESISNNASPNKASLNKASVKKASANTASHRDFLVGRLICPTLTAEHGAPYP